MATDPDCRLCRLCDGRIQVVLPDGDPRSPLLLIGEGPGEKEDLQGRPFVGRAGKWLDKCFHEAGLERERVYITNTVRCRPPRNRRPMEDEVASCRPYLIDELRGRRLVLPLGATATSNLLGRPVKMSEEANRPREVEIDGIMVMVLPTYHPSACIYNKIARQRLSEALAMAKGLCGLV
jgi:uracil-DNA glycosylase family 4